MEKVKIYVKRTNKTVPRSGYIHVPHFSASNNDHESAYVKPAIGKVMEVDANNSMVDSYLKRGFLVPLTNQESVILHEKLKKGEIRLDIDKKAIAKAKQDQYDKALADAKIRRKTKAEAKTKKKK